MPAWLTAVIVNFFLGSVMSKLKASEAKIDWAGMQAQIDAKISALPYGSFVDSELQVVAANCITAVELLLNGPLQQTLLSDILVGNFVGAIAALEAAIQAVVK